MRKLWFRRRAVSSMIGGLIILVIFLSTLVFMFAMTQQYDAYQSTVAAMQQKQIDMYSENLLASYPGIELGTGTLVGVDYQVPCAGGGQCNNYTLLMNNLGLTTQAARIYIYQAGSNCNPCILNPAYPAAPNSFRSLDEYVNSGEFAHNFVFWLPTGTSLSICTNASECKISLVTARGRVFSFLYPFPLSAAEGSGANSGATGIFIGPLVITFQKALITYTDTQTANPPVPIGGNNGYWTLPSGTDIIIYIKIQTDVNTANDVYLTPQSVFELSSFSSPGTPMWFYAVDPITPTFCQMFIPSPNPNNYNTDLDCTLPTYLTNGNTGIVSSLALYGSCGKPPATYASNCSARYIIPKPNAAQIASNKRGTPVIVAFAVSKVGTTSGTKIQKISSSAQWSGHAVTSFLGLSYVYDQGDGTGPYLYGVTLPFMTMCIDSCSI